MYYENEPRKGNCKCLDNEEKKTNKCSLCGGGFTSGGVCISGDLICGECIEDVDIFDLLQLIGCDSVAQLIGMIDGI